MRDGHDGPRTGPLSLVEASRDSLTILAVKQSVRGVRSGIAAHNAVGPAGESPVVGIDCLPT